jgi:hypothetical protein
MSTSPRRPARKAAAPAPTVAKPAAKAVVKAAAKAKPAKPKAAKPAAAPAAPKAAAKPPKKAKPVLVRDSFTMPEADFALIASLKQRAAVAGRESKKSELLRAGLQALDALNAPALLAALNALAPVKVGRPRKGH